MSTGVEDEHGKYTARQISREHPLTCKTARLVKWNVDVPHILKEVHARRDDTNVAPWEGESNARLTMVTVLEEVKEIIHLPPLAA
jgi:hypothetical protein